ncbi:MAG: ferrochelatase [Acidobacteria bacterium]|nr:ferrochelatase [Acidobacteriota bacterium]
MTRPPLGVLLLQLGTPDAPTPAALRRYLAQFLSDRRVIDLPRWQWLPVLYGIVLRTRPRKSAAEYAKVWTPEGAPLLVTSRRQAALVEERLTAAGVDARVRVAMRYGDPSTESALGDLEAAGVDRIVALPMYPQYASATSGSSLEDLYRAAGRRRVVPALSVVPPYFDAPGYIDALAAVTRQSLAGWTPDHLVLSFHGIPERYVREGDPYASHCQATAEALRAVMGWPSTQVTASFQSRFGREVWLQPYTDATLRRLGEARTARVAVLCPGFTADCLETIDEIGNRERHKFEAAGGGELRLVPCLNDSPAWIEAMQSMVQGVVSGHVIV